MPSRLFKNRLVPKSQNRSSIVAESNRNELPNPAVDVNWSRPWTIPAVSGTLNLDPVISDEVSMANANYSNSYAAFSNGKSTSTIRPVASFEAPSEDSSDEPSLGKRNSGFSSSINSNASATSYMSQSQTPTHTHSQSQPHNGSEEVRPNEKENRISEPHGSEPLTSTSNSTLKDHDNRTDSSAMLQVPDSHMDHANQSAREGSPQWDGAVGKAALGKTGRVINKLVSDNEALKRDIKFERIKAEEAKQTAKLMEDKMERTISEYESRLLEANVTKTLLSRKERQVEHLQAAIELEKKRTADAQERERKWRDEMEKGRRDASTQVEEAKHMAAMMEGRYNAIASHWKEQGEEVKRRALILHEEIAVLVLERKKDDDKINTLRDLCDQQDGNIRDLKQQKEDIGDRFEIYKREQEEALKDIKSAATQREEDQMRTIEESKRVLGELKWALNVKKNVAGAG